jgi:hypothetical protein
MSRKSTFSLIAIAAIAATGSILASGQASASIGDNYKRCGGSSYSQVFGCCQAWVESNRPLWMRQGREDCSSPGVIVCKSSRNPNYPGIAAATGKPKKVCYLVPQTTTDSHDPNTPKGNPNTRGGNNGNNTGGNLK